MYSSQSLLLAALCLPAAAAACEAQSVPASSIAAAEILLLGQVTGARYPQYEAEVARVGKSAEVSPLEARIVRVYITDALRGTAPQTAEVTSYPCDAMRPIVGDRVVLYGSDPAQLLAVPATLYEAELQAIVRKRP